MGIVHLAVLDYHQLRLVAPFGMGLVVNAHRGLIVTSSQVVYNPTTAGYRPKVLRPPHYVLVGTRRCWSHNAAAIADPPLNHDSHDAVTFSFVATLVRDQDIGCGVCMLRITSRLASDVHNHCDVSIAHVPGQYITNDDLSTLQSLLFSSLPIQQGDRIQMVLNRGFERDNSCSLAAGTVASRFNDHCSSTLAQTLFCIDMDDDKVAGVAAADVVAGQSCGYAEEGSPVFDLHGRVIGIITIRTDRSVASNDEMDCETATKNGNMVPTTGASRQRLGSSVTFAPVSTFLPMLHRVCHKFNVTIPIVAEEK